MTKRSEDVRRNATQRSDPSPGASKRKANHGTRSQSASVQKQSRSSNTVSCNPPMHLANVNRQDGQTGRTANEDAERHWTEVKKDRNRLNAKRSRNRQQQQISTLEAENMRLAVSNDALRFQNTHLKDAILRINEEREKKKVAAKESSKTMPPPSNQISQPLSSQISQQQLAADPICRPLSNQMSLQQIAADQISQPLSNQATLQQLVALLLGNDLSAGQQLSIGTQEIARLLGTTQTSHSANFSGPPQYPGTTSTAGIVGSFCCAEYQLYCALADQPQIRIPPQLRRHNLRCPNNMFR
eukprot:scaffold17901_cov157-Cylindrotheca_fusiformis.AAC.1